MSFSTVFFVFTWLPISLILYYALPQKLKNIYLLLISLLFYAWSQPSYIFLMLIMIAINYFLGSQIDKQTKYKKELLFLAVGANIFMLFYFKYYGFVLDSFFTIIPLQLKYQLFDMPLGVSFFTFSCISYLIEVYRKDIKCVNNLFNFALYVTYFPKLIMGPICTYEEFASQLKKPNLSINVLSDGAKRFIIGLAQKVILANTFASLFSSLQNTSDGLGAWLIAIAYTLQIYFDFVGYTNMAIGLSNMMGFKMPENFNYPYISVSVSDFWRRWHMTLGRFFRNYVYIPLGGNRVAKNDHIRNLLVVWMLTGLWHGANWTFIIWGLYYGLFIILEKYALSSIKEKLPNILNWAITMFVVIIGWVFFFSNSIGEAFGLIIKMFSFTTSSESLFYLKTFSIYLIIGIVASTPIVKNISNNLNKRFNKYYYLINNFGGIVLFVVSIGYMISTTYQSFLYFAF